MSGGEGGGQQVKEAPRRLLAGLMAGLPGRSLAQRRPGAIKCCLGLWLTQSANVGSEAEERPPAKRQMGDRFWRAGMRRRTVCLGAEVGQQRGGSGRERIELGGYPLDKSGQSGREHSVSAKGLRRSQFLAVHVARRHVLNHHAGTQGLAARGILAGADDDAARREVGAHAAIACMRPRPPRLPTPRKSRSAVACSRATSAGVPLGAKSSTTSGASLKSNAARSR